MKNIYLAEQKASCLYFFKLGDAQTVPTISSTFISQIFHVLTINRIIPFSNFLPSCMTRQQQNAQTITEYNTAIIRTISK